MEGRILRLQKTKRMENKKKKPLPAAFKYAVKHKMKWNI